MKTKNNSLKGKSAVKTKKASKEAQTSSRTFIPYWKNETKNLELIPSPTFEQLYVIAGQLAANGSTSKPMSLQQCAEQAYDLWCECYLGLQSRQAFHQYKSENWNILKQREFNENAENSKRTMEMTEAAISLAGGKVEFPLDFDRALQLIIPKSIKTKTAREKLLVNFLPESKIEPLHSILGISGDHVEKLSKHQGDTISGFLKKLKDQGWSIEEFVGIGQGFPHWYEKYKRDNRSKGQRKNL